jgi:hypothetical protein
MNAEHIETPIQRILRENEARKASQTSTENIETIASRLFNLEQLKTQLGLVSKNNISAYQAKINKQSRSNKFEQTKDKVNQLSALIRKSNAALAGA